MRLSLLFMLVSLVSLSSFSNPVQPEKILILKVDETGLVTDGHDHIGVHELADYIRERLFRNYMGTGRMYDRIHLVKTSGSVTSEQVDVLVKEISEGQKKALTELCLEKYKDNYQNLATRKQDKIRKQFPVLFQSDYLAS